MFQTDCDICRESFEISADLYWELCDGSQVAVTCETCESLAYEWGDPKNRIYMEHVLGSV
jgi:hypothetical protein